MSYWLNKAIAANGELNAVIQRYQLDPSQTKDASDRLAHLVSAGGNGRPRWSLVDRASGEAQSEVWTAVHGLEEGVLVALKSKSTRGDHIDYFHRQAELHAGRLKASEATTKLAEFHRLKGRHEWNDAMDEAITIVQLAHERSADAHNTERSTGRGLVAVSIGLLVVVVAIGVMQASGVKEFIVPKPDKTNLSATRLYTLVALFGALGGALSAVTLYLTNKVKPTSWHDPRPVLAFHKVAWGIAAALLGAMIIGTNALVGDYSSLPAALIGATVFGYSQQLLTRYFDKQASTLVDPSKKSTD